jgi:hypothetical protein
MSNVKKPRLPQTREEKILARPKPAIGTYPGQNRSRKFVDRKKKANKNACRGNY